MNSWGQPLRRLKRGRSAPFWNKSPEKRASLEKDQSRQAERGPMVVKGISKRVIVVRSPDPRIFEQAIFVVREDFVGQAGISERELMRQARASINGYLLPGEKNRRLLPWLRGALYAAAGAAGAALTWVMVQMSHMM